MKRIGFVSLIIYALLAATSIAPAQTVSNGKATTAAPAYTNNTARPLSLDLLGNLRTTGGAGATAQEVQGNVAADAPDSGNPVKIGGVFNNSLPTVTDGDRSNIQTDARGAVFTVLKNSGSSSGSTAVAAINTTATGGDATAGNLGALYAASFQQKFNGATWDRDFTCPNSAVITVTAGATTQLVALSASTVIRVCSFVIASSATGTAQFITGTGANCATGPANLTGAMPILANANIAASAGNGSLFRGIAANALCLAAVTGNINGFVSYAQY